VSAVRRDDAVEAQDLVELRRVGPRAVGGAAVPRRVAARHQHPLIAERLVRLMPHHRTTARVLRHVHERYDGTGYPDGLAGERIPLASRVLHAAIAFEAMVSSRPYRAPLSFEQAREELRRVARSQLDPEVVEALEAILDSDPPAWALARAPIAPAPR